MTSRQHILTGYQVSVEARVGDEVVEPNVGYFPWVLGASLAEQVDHYRQLSGLSYYPAVDFFRDKFNEVDPALIMLIDEVSRYCIEYSRRECRRRLNRAFATVSVLREQALSYAMPRVRPRQSDAVDELAEHYAPNVVRLEFTLQHIDRIGQELSEILLSQLIEEQCQDAFSGFRVVDLHATQIRRSPL